jgi:hypothetical protein
MTSDANSLSGIGATLGSGLTTNVSALAVTRESESLTISLKDGTQVTFRMGAGGTATASAQTNADGSSSMTASLSGSSQIEVSVSSAAGTGGNLSSADLQAISDVVSQVDSLATQFFSGDVQDAFAAAASLKADPTEIAGLSLKLTYSAATAAAATATTDSTAARSPSPQQIIINFMQQAVTRLSRGSDQSQLNGSPHWKLQVLASALPAYAPTPAARLAAAALTHVASHCGSAAATP